MPETLVHDFLQDDTDIFLPNQFLLQFSFERLCKCRASTVDKNFFRFCSLPYIFELWSVSDKLK